jgi:uncharacterized membrane protein YgdD (TMEM256/DUF423 family)
VQTGFRSQPWFVFAGLSLLLATILGAFGTHALKPVLPPARFDSFETGVNYQFFQTLGLCVILLMRSRADSVLLRWSSRFIVIGLALFCGSIYALTFGAPRVFGMVAPLGGSSFMIAWLLFAIGIGRAHLSPDRP